MAIDLSTSDNNEFTLFDIPSGSKVKFYYKNPDTETQIKYRSALLNVSIKNKSIEDIQKIQLEWALKLITGIRNGDFIKDGKPISSIPEDENYYSEWKELLKKQAGSLLLKFLETLLEAPCYPVKDEAANADFFTGNTKVS